MRHTFIFAITLLVQAGLCTNARTEVVAEYRTAIQQIQKLITMANMHIGCEIYSFNHQQTIYRHNADKLFTPASNTKLFLATLALEILGPDYTFPTALLTDGTQIDDTIEGNVYFKGSGDPSLTYENVKKIINHICQNGIKCITGNFFLDLDDFDHNYFPPGSYFDLLGQQWNPPICSLIIDKKPVLFDNKNISFLNTNHNEIFLDANNFFSSLLAYYGITLYGTITSSNCTNQTEILYEHHSAPVVQLLEQALKESDNLYADCIFKRIAANCHGCPGTWQKGTQTLFSFLQQALNLSSTDLLIKDGSGRALYNLLSPHHIVQLLRYIYDQSYVNQLQNCLPINGIDGTLKNRMLSIPSHIKAKTGTHAGTSCLSGYIQTDCDVLAFSILINGFITDTPYTPACKKEIEDTICQILVTG